MYNKTTNPFFHEFGLVIDRENYQSGHSFLVTSQTFTQMFELNEPITISVESGIAMIVCAHSSLDTPKKFVIHSEIQLKPNVLFNFIAITSTATITISHNLNKIKPTHTLPSTVEYEKITRTFKVKEIYTYYHQLKPPGYHFKGETLPYWELTYVDNGNLEMKVDNINYELNAFDLMICAPNQFHTQAVTSKKSCTYLTIIFELDIDTHPKLINKVFKYNYQIRDILNDFIRQTNSNEFEIHLKDVLIAELNTLLAKLMVVHLEHPIRRANKSPQHRQIENQMLKEVTRFMEQNIYSPIMIEDICHHFGISRTTLQNLFQSELNISPKLFINNLRLDMSKVLLRESKHTISEISSSLGFSSIQYFSKKFKHRFKISPREYAKSNYN